MYDSCTIQLVYCIAIGELDCYANNCQICVPKSAFNPRWSMEFILFFIHSIFRDAFLDLRACLVKICLKKKGEVSKH